jgi:hypothetical protein
MHWRLSLQFGRTQHQNDGAKNLPTGQAARWNRSKRLKAVAQLSGIYCDIVARSARYLTVNSETTSTPAAALVNQYN